VTVAIAFVPWCSTLHADISLNFGIPRFPEYTFTRNSVGGTVSVFAADTVENWEEILTTSDSSFTVNGVTTEQPYNLDAGDRAYAIAVYQNDLPLFFFQIRIAGSSAELLDSSLASEAVSANLWSSTDDYFEFPPGHAIIFQNFLEHSGPASFSSSILPEPTTLSMLFLATCCFPSRLLRRTASDNR